MTETDWDAELSSHSMLLRTLEDFSALGTLGTGTVLYPSAGDGTELSTNLHAALVATSLGHKSLDYAKRMLPDVVKEAADPIFALYQRAYFEARCHIKDAKKRLVVDSTAALTNGEFAASVALQRLESGLFAAHLLYRLGLNFEGDALSRQVLEQVAWAFAVEPLESMKDVEDVEAQKKVTNLKRLYPAAGTFCGELSNVAHAGLAEHRRTFHVADDRPSIVTARSRFADSARYLSSLADVWVLVWEVVQRKHLQDFTAIQSATDPTPRSERPYAMGAASLVAEISRLERAAAAEARA